MINAILTKIMGSKNERAMKKLQPTVERINGLESTTRDCSDEQLVAKRDEFR